MRGRLVVMGLLLAFAAGAGTGGFVAFRAGVESQIGHRLSMERSGVAEYFRDTDARKSLAHGEQGHICSPACWGE